MQFMPSVKHHAFTQTYIVNRITMRKTKKYVSITDHEKSGQTELLKKDVLLITHTYDTNCLFLTAPIIFNTKQVYPEFKNVVLETLMEKIQMHSETEPELVTSNMDCTNRYAWGKVYVWVNKIINFPFFNSVFVRLSVQPWSLTTKRIMDNKFEFK